MCQKLCSTLVSSSSTSYHYSWEYKRRAIYRQRGWIFFEDARFYPGGDDLSHFPTLIDMKRADDLTKSQISTSGCSRDQRRSQTWHDKNFKQELSRSEDVENKNAVPKESQDEYVRDNKSQDRVLADVASDDTSDNNSQIKWDTKIRNFFDESQNGGFPRYWE